MHILPFFLMAIMVTKSSQLNATDCGSSYRIPLPTDISVDCGTSFIRLTILICPAIYSGYNESLLIINDARDDPSCAGTLDISVTPPVVRFLIPFNKTNACGSDFKTTSSQGTGVLSDFSNIQSVNMSGVVRSYDVNPAEITYYPELKYHYSCAYPLEYVVNEFRFDVSSASIAVKDTNGTFVSTLRLKLFSDVNYTEPMQMTSLGIELRTNIYAQVSATNLTANYHVLLDRCFAALSAEPTNSTFFNLFIPCSIDKMTTIIENGDSHRARFSFPAFRFSEQHNEITSSYYLHCITRLCETSTCSEVKQCGGGRRRRRYAEPPVPPQDRIKTLTAQIVTKTETDSNQDEMLAGSEKTDSSVGLAVGLGVLGFLCIIVICVAAIIYKKRCRY